MSELPKESHLSGDFISAGASSQQSHRALLACGGVFFLLPSHAEPSLVRRWSTKESRKVSIQIYFISFPDNDALPPPASPPAGACAHLSSAHLSSWPRLVLVVLNTPGQECQSSWSPDSAPTLQAGLCFQPTASSPG